MPLTRREFAQTLLATTAVAALVPVWPRPHISGDILDPGFQRVFTDPDSWFLVEPPDEWHVLTATDLNVEFDAILNADWRFVVGSEVS